jgi:hypothetical protein
MNDKLKIVYRPLKELTPYARNARTHSGEQVAQLVASIEEFGWTNPVLLEENGEIIAGHGRVIGGTAIVRKTIGALFGKQAATSFGAGLLAHPVIATILGVIAPGNSLVDSEDAKAMSDLIKNWQKKPRTTFADWYRGLERTISSAIRTGRYFEK